MLLLRYVLVLQTVARGVIKYTHCSGSMSNVLRANGFRYFSIVPLEERLEAIILFVLISACYCGSVASIYLMMTFRFSVMLFSRSVFAFRLDRLAPVILLRGSTLFYY